MEEYNNSNYVELTNNYIIKTFFRMFLGLLSTALVAIYSYKTGLYMNISFGVLAVIEIAVVLLFSLLFRKLPPIVVTILYFVYAIVNGLTMGVIFAIYDISTIGYAFLITSLLFGGLAAYGYFTKRDVSKWSTVLLVALAIGLIVSVINIFIGNTIVEIILDWVILLIFCGLTIYDINKIKNGTLMLDVDEEKLYIYYAMDLYLDFINIFLRILSIFGRSRD